jgi:hypothetical protein
MKRTILFFTSICLTISVFGQSFTGKVTVTNSLQSDQVTTFLIDGDKAAIMPEGPGVYPGVKHIVDRQTGDYHTVVPMNGKIRLSTANLSDQSFMAISNNQKPEVLSTAETKTIDGFSARKYLVEYPQGKAEVWATNEIENLDMASFMSAKSLAREGKFYALDEVEGFVLEIHGVSPRGGQKFTIKNKVDIQAVPASTFDLPSGSNVIDVNALNQQMKAAKGDPQKMKELKENIKEIHKN